MIENTHSWSCPYDKDTGEHKKVSWWLPDFGKIGRRSVSSPIIHVIDVMFCEDCGNSWPYSSDEWMRRTPCRRGVNPQDYLPHSSTGRDVLDLCFKSNDLGDISVRGYFRTLLSKLWEQGEGFNGKRPYGNSGWQFDVYAALIRNGFLEGELDEDGYVGKMDEKKAAEYVQREIIDRLFQ